MRLMRLAVLADPLKWLLATAAVGLGLLACGDGGDGPITTTTQSNVTLTGDQEVPAVATGALGSGSFSLQSPSRQLTGSITLNGMTATVAHVHEGAVGVNGPAIVTLVETSPGVWTVPSGTVLTEAQAAAFASGGLYVNAHNAAFPNGEIRGQIGREVFNTALSGSQEVPPTPSLATGTGQVVLDPVTRRISARLTVSGMAATMAHIHEGAAGVNGPILVHLTQTAPGSGIWVSAPDATFTEAHVAALRAGNLYFNAHSLAFPGGEIRGQIARTVSFVTLSGAQEVPPTASVATGTGTFVVDPLTRAASGSITLTGMTATMAHVHQGPAGTNGPVIITLVNTSGNTWSVPANTVLTAAQLQAFKQGNLYYNAHSLAFPNGEIRGQIR